LAKAKGKRSEYVNVRLLSSSLYDARAVDEAYWMLVEEPEGLNASCRTVYRWVQAGEQGS